MKLKKIKPGHIANCPYCKAQGNKVQATWHLTFENKQACDVHKFLLEHIRDRANKEDGGYADYSEGDYQSWLRVV